MKIIQLSLLMLSVAFSAYAELGNADSNRRYRCSDGRVIDPSKYIEMSNRPQRASDAPVRWLDVTVEKAGELAAALGEQANEIDSLVVRGPINDDDFNTLWSASFNGDLAVMNLEHATVESGVVPKYAFWHPSEQEYPEGGLVHFTPINLRRIMLPEGVTEIRDDAFSWAYRLETVDLPSTLRYLGFACFAYCKSLNLNSFVFYDGLEEIDDKAFDSCYRQGGELNLPSSLKRIGYAAFWGTGLSKVSIPEGVRIEEYAFNSNRLEELDLPACELVGDGHFSSNHPLKRVSLSEGLTRIPRYFLNSCESLKEINIPSTVDTIKSAALRNAYLDKLVLPEGLKYVAPYSIRSCVELHIPSTIERLELGTFGGMSTLRTIYCTSPTPPKFERDTQSGSLAGPFGNPLGDPNGQTPQDATVYVPVGSKKLYEEAQGWGDYFTNFVETADLPQASVEGIKADSPDADAPMYDLMGRQITHPAHGQLYIQNGKKRVHWDR